MSKRNLIPHFNICCRWSLWCVVDTLIQCRSKTVCDRHDREITGGDPDGE